MLAVLLIVGLGAIAGGGYGLYAQLTRHATVAEASAAGQREVASRWLRLPAGQIFPATVSYQSTQVGGRASAHLVGIAPRTSCAAATDPAIGAILARSRCQAILRATYADSSGTLLGTFGVGVMPDAADAADTFESLHPGPGVGVRTVSFPGTVAGSFGDAQRAEVLTQYQGPYIFFYAVGFADGRVTHAAGGDSSLEDLGYGVIDSIISILTSDGSPCHDKDIRC